MKIELMEHKTQNLKVTPFSIKANPYVVGRTKEKELLTEFIKNGNICFLTGPPGTGKSSLLLWLNKNLKTRNTFYIDAANIEKNFSIKEFLKNSRRGLDVFRDYPKDSIILLDESQDCDSELQKALKLHWDHNHIKSIVVTQICPKLENFSNSFKDRIGNRIIRVGKLKEPDAIALIKSRAGDKNPFDKKTMEEIARKADYRPRKILEICELINIQSRENSQSNLPEIKKILAKNKRPNKKRTALKANGKKISLNPEEDEAYEPNETNIRLTLLQKKILLSLKKGNKTAKEIAENLKVTEGIAENELKYLCEKKILVNRES